MQLRALGEVHHWHEVLASIVFLASQATVDSIAEQLRPCHNRGSGLLFRDDEMRLG